MSRRYDDRDGDYGYRADREDEYTQHTYRRYDDREEYDDRGGWYEEPGDRAGRRRGEYDEWSDRDRDDRDDRNYEERRIRAQRRAERRARREQELKRARQRMIATAAAGIGAVAVVLILVFGVRGRAAQDESNSAGTASDIADAVTDTADASDVSGEALSGDDADGNDAGDDTAADDDSGETAASVDTLTLPYSYYETADTIDLGESLTDISIYDSQRHITSTAVSTETADAEEDSSESAAESGTGAAEDAADTDSEGSAETVYGDSSDESAEDTESSDGTSATDDDYIDSQYVIVVNADTGEIIAERNAYEQIIPASMTKVMTLLVAIEAMEDYETAITDTFTITQEITDESYLSGSSFVGYGVGDVATVEDLLYGTILPSGADAALALAEYTAGSKEAFVALMNAKCEELGIADTTHFTNVIGLYDDGENYSTPYDMCVIMNAAIDNEYCQAILSQRTWTTQAIMNNPDGTTISNWFLRRAEDHIDNWEILCGKTGFVNESGNCAVSYMKSSVTGTNYIVCTALTYSSWRCIYDHAAIYNYYTE